MRGRPWTSLTWADHKKIRKIYKEDEPNREMRKTRRLLGSLAKQRKAGVPQPKPKSFRDFAKKRKIEADRREDRAEREKAGTIKPLKAKKGGLIKSRKKSSPKKSIDGVARKGKTKAKHR